MRRNLVIDASVKNEDVFQAAYIAMGYIRNIPEGAPNPHVIEGYVLSYGDKNVFIKRLKIKE